MFLYFCSYIENRQKRIKSNYISLVPETVNLQSLIAFLETKNINHTKCYNDNDTLRKEYFHITFGVVSMSNLIFKDRNSLLCRVNLSPSMSCKVLTLYENL